ncbi:MAG: nucleoside triphosphate pyrophosphatase [Thermoanaerobaculales bacterium]
MTPLILASGSPRRRRLLEFLGVAFQVCPAEIEEVPAPGESPEVFVRRAAREKALEVARTEHGAAVLGADTIVELDGAILGKPASNEEAGSMLRALSGREHKVHTAIALALDGTCHDLVDTTRVRFLDLNDRIIRWYVATGEPRDKAGAYAVQGLGGLMVAGIEGSPHTVVGLPIQRLAELFETCGLDFWSLIPSGGQLT